MRLVVKKKGDTVNEFRFTKGPVYIGRHTHSQVFLPDRAVSRQHAVIFQTQDGKWMLEDLDSANKTYLNGEPIHKAEIKTGDSLLITDFTVEINLEEDTDVEKAMILPARRAKDFAQATETICETNGLDEMIETLLRIIARQFSAFHTWCALRSEPTGPMISHAGKRRDGKVVQISDIKLNEKINEAIEKSQFLLLPKVPAQLGEERIRSAMIAPVVGPAGCFGVIYIDNAMDNERYGPGDLDYLMLLAVHTASILKNF